MLPAVYLQRVTGDIRGGVTTHQLPPRALHQPGACSVIMKTDESFAALSLNEEEDEV